MTARTEVRISAGEASRIIGVSAKSVRVFAEAGRLAGEKTQLGWIFARADVERFAADRRRAAGQDA